MRTMDQWFAEYAKSHQNPLNIKIHYICVPAIFFSVLGILWVIPSPVVESVRIPWTLIFIALAAIFYFTLNIKLGSIIVVIALACSWLLWQMELAGFPLLAINLAIFVLAWIGQAYGHKVEGKKPSFFDDLAFLLIGPLWVLKKSLSGRA